MLDGKLVRTIHDIHRFSDDSTPKTIVEAGTEFVWDDSAIEQNIDGKLVMVEEANVELVNA